MLDYFNQSFEVENKLSLWTFLTFLVIVNGLLGFYTFQGRLGLPLSVPPIQVISAFGIYIIGYLALIGMFSRPGHQNYTLSVIKVIVVLSFMTYNYQILAVASIAFFWVYSKANKINGSENTEGKSLEDVEILGEVDSVESDTKNVMTKRGGIDGYYFLITALGLLFSIPLLIVFQFTFALIEEGNYIWRTKKYHLYQVFIALIVVPVSISYHSIVPAGKGLLGISYHQSKVELNNDTEINSIMVYQDNNFIYFKDNLLGDEVTVIQRSAVRSMKLEVVDKIFSKEGLFFYVKNYINGDPMLEGKTTNIDIMAVNPDEILTTDSIAKKDTIFEVKLETSGDSINIRK